MIFFVHWIVTDQWHLVIGWKSKSFVLWISIFAKMLSLIFLFFFAKKLEKRIGQIDASVAVGCFHCNILEGVWSAEFDLCMQWSGRTIGTAAAFEPITSLFPVTVLNSFSNLYCCVTNTSVNEQNRFIGDISRCAIICFWHFSFQWDTNN